MWPLNVVWFWQAVGMAVVVGVLNWCETSAALRGQTGEPMPDYLQRMLRVFFFTLLLGPLAYQFPWLLVLFVPYLYSYVDLSEIHCGRPSLRLKNFVLWKMAIKYLQLKLVKTVDLPATKQYIFGIHPHGVLPFGGVLNVTSDLTGFDQLFPGIERRGLAATFVFLVPGYRDLMLGAGICDAARFSARRVLESGRSLYLVPGGATEALYSRADSDVLVLRKRRGFVRLALQHGASLVPCFSFNENNLFEQFDTSAWPSIEYCKKKFQAIFGISLPLIKSPIPCRAQITTVVGAPIDCPKIAAPSDKQIADVLGDYERALVELYNRHAEQYNRPADKGELVVL
jgi:2-acylglycerol O-acyltransferase 2